MLKLYYFPPYIKRNTDTNPYSKFYKESLSHYFDVIEKNYQHNGFARLSFLKKVFLADVYVLNWIESIGSGAKNFILFLSSYLGILIILIRRKKIVWMLHNIHPHIGENFYTRVIQRVLYRKATIIITHSQDALNYSETKANCKVYYRCHPVNQMSFKMNIISDTEFDVLIWGAILPYKGIGEFLSLPEIRNSSLKIKVIGMCKDKNLEHTILKNCNEHIFFENRFACMEELYGLCQKAKYVLFPYLPDTVSSSGVLIETIAMGGTPVGPNIGAFKDMAEYGLCITYLDSADMLRKLEGEKKIDVSKRMRFLEENSWERFGEFVYKTVINEVDN